METSEGLTLKIYLDGNFTKASCKYLGIEYEIDIWSRSKNFSTKFPLKQYQIILCGLDTEVSEVLFRLSIPHTSHAGHWPIALWQKAQNSKGAKENLS